MGFLIALSRGVFEQTNAKDLYQVLSDSFFVPAVVITGFGLLIFASNEGVFDGISYGVKAFLGMFKSKQEKKYKSLYEYKEQKHAVKTETKFILISGLIILAISIVFYILYANV